MKIPHRRLRVLFVSAFAALAAAVHPAFGQPLRVVTWNITNYGGGRAADLQTVIYGEFQGRTMAPDIILTQEFQTQNAVDFFLIILNNFPGGPTDWAAAPFINGPDTDSAFFYRTSRVELLPPYVTVVSVGGPSPNHPRNVQRYDIRPVGYAADAATVAMYSTHMKAANTAEDRARRLVEAQVIVSDALALPSGWHFLVAGDFNIYTSTEPAYTQMVGPNPFFPTGPFFDPIRTPGSWNNNFNFRFVHTQDPVGPGGMDDRFDQILLSGSLLDGAGFDYVGSLTTPYSTTTWNDPNHSYRAWGNDGTSFDQQLRVEGNTMVGPAIAQSIRNVGQNAGHVPVLLDLRVPARIDADVVVDFGQVAMGSGSGVVNAVVSVRNAADTALWTEAGIADLRYTLEASTGFSAPTGTFVRGPGMGVDTHLIAMDTTTPGVISGTLHIHSDAPNAPVWTVALTGEVLGGALCSADWNNDGLVNSGDITAFLTGWLASIQDGTLAGDFNGDGQVNSGDITAFLSAWLQQVGDDC